MVIENILQIRKRSVLRLSRDGMTEISSYGMHDFFRDELADATKVVGGWNSHTKDYVLSLQTKPLGHYQLIL